MFCEKEEMSRPELAQQVWLLSEGSYLNGSPWSLEQFEDDINQETSQYLFLLEKQQLIGFISYYSIFGEVDITHVVINKEYQHQGYGKKMLRELVKKLADSNHEKLFLEVRPSNLAAIDVYKKVGFEVISIRKNYYQKPKEDAWIMCCKIRK